MDMNEIYCMEWAQTTLKLQVRETTSCTFVRESAAEFFLAPEGMKVGQGFFSMESLGVLWLVFDTGLSVTPLMGHLGCLASHWSVPVVNIDQGVR